MNASVSSDDASLAETIVARLSQPLDLDVDDLTVTVRDGRVELSGTVPLQRMVNPIMTIARECAGVVAVENKIRVDTPNVNAEYNRYPVDEEPMSATDAPGARQINHEV